MQDVETRSTARRRRRRMWVGAGAGALVAGTAFVLVWFQPQKLFIDDTVDEALPGLVAPAVEVADETSSTVPDATGAPVTTHDMDTAETAAPASAPVTLADFSALARETGVPQVVSSAPFVGLDHATSGTALVVALADGGVVVRFEDLDTDNGPDLHVVLTPHGPETGEYGGRIELGRLKGNQGDQNYEVPTELDWSSIRSVVVWCDRFSSPFGAAALNVQV